MAKVVRGSKGGLSHLLNITAKLDGQKLEVGVFESSKYEDGTPVAGVAAVQEFGSPKAGIPPRPFMRTTIDEKRGEIKSLFDRAAKAIYSGDTDPVTALNVIGGVVAGQIKTTISNINEPALSPVTLHLRKLKKEGIKITGAIVNDAKRRAAKGEDLDTSGVSSKPLIEDAILINSMSHAVSK